MRHQLKIALAAICLPLFAGSSLPAFGADKEPSKEAAKDQKEAPKKESLAELLKGASDEPGLLGFHRKEESSYATIPKSLLDKPLWISSNLRKGVGSSWIYANSLGPAWIGRLRAGPNKTIQLVAQNTRAATEFAPKDPAYALMAAADFPESLLATWPIKASDDSTYAVDANAIAVNDLGGWAAKMEAAFKAPYAIDAAASSIVQVANSPTETIFAARLNLHAAKLPAGARSPSIPDARSAFIETALSVSLLPEEPMKPRSMDERVGLFHAERLDLSPGSKIRPRIAFGARWRLAKKDPLADRSEPVEPIVFHICPAMPERYVKTVKEGILAWNKAFDALGYIQAVQAVADKDDSAILAGGRKASVCFVAADDIHAALGPSKLDPRTGEILEARVLLPEIFMNKYRINFDAARQSDPVGSPEGYRVDSMEATGAALGWSESEREDHALGQFRAIVSHEIGHALGLRHNFKASAAYPFALISAPGYRGPISSSFMDYLPANVYAGRPPSSASAFQSEVGAYDMWAIAYAYSEFPDEESERKGLAEILDKSSTDTLLAFGDDEDAYGEGAMDPKTTVYDLSSEPLEFAASRADLAQHGINAMAREAREGRLAPDKIRQGVAEMFEAATRSSDSLRRYFGGADFSRQQAGSSKPVMTPIDPGVQRKAMDHIVQRLLGPVLIIPPELLARAAAPELSRGSANPSFDLDNKILHFQAGIIRPFFTPVLTDQIMDAQILFIPGPGKKPPMELREIERALFEGVWRELRTGEAITRGRRNLQRSYVDDLAASLKNPGNLSTDPRSNFRELAEDLRAMLGRQAANPKRSAQERIDIRDKLLSIQAALAAGLVRDKP